MVTCSKCMHPRKSAKATCQSSDSYSGMALEHFLWASYLYVQLVATRSFLTPTHVPRFSRPWRAGVAIIKKFPTRSTLIADGGEPPYDGDMEARIKKLEDHTDDVRDRLTKIEVRLEQSATKADLHEQTQTMIKWLIGTALTVAALGLALLNFTKSSPAGQTQPQVMQQSQPASVVYLAIPAVPAMPASSASANNKTPER